MNPEGSIITEGSTKILIPENHSVHGPGKIMGTVFFNEQMSFNRDISVMFLRAMGRDMTVADAMTATGSRAVRIANEVPNCEVTANDISADAIPYIDANIELNGLENCRSSNRNMHGLFADETFDYVDLDPFGSPVPFIQSAYLKESFSPYLASASPAKISIAFAFAPNALIYSLKVSESTVSTATSFKVFA